MNRARHTLAVVISIVLHLGAFVWGELSFVTELEVPDIEIDLIEVDVIDPDQVMGEVDTPAPPAPPAAAPEPPPPPAPAEPQVAPEEPANEEPAKDTEPERRLRKRSSKVDKLAPENSTFYALLVPRKIRKLKFREHALDIMAPLPDFDLLISKGGLDPLRDFDHIVIASPNIRNWTQTFLAVDYRVSREEIKAAIERAVDLNGEAIQWQEQDGVLLGNPKPKNGEPDIDKRHFVLLEDKVAVYVHRRFLKHVLADDVDDQNTTGNYVANLTKLRRFAARHPTAGMQLVLRNFKRSVRSSKNIPFELPDHIEVVAEAKSDPELMIRASFVSGVDASQAEKWWKKNLGEKIRSSLTLRMSVGWIYDMLEVSRKRKVLSAWGRFNEEQATLVLQTIAGFSAKLVRKTPEEIAQARRQRLENWKKRRGGKLGPSALRAEEAPDASPAEADVNPETTAEGSKAAAPSERPSLQKAPSTDADVDPPAEIPPV